MDITIKLLNEKASLPEYQTTGSAAADVAACLDAPITIEPGARHVVPTGFAMQLPKGYEVQLRARSGLSSKYGIALANGIGTIDADYRGEIGVILINHGQEPFLVEHGMRIAQLVVGRVEQASWRQVEELEETERGAGGYGSTGH